MELISLLLASLFVAPPLPAEPDAEPGLSRDAYGDPLPEGAVARYGTLRYRGGFPGCVAFSPDGKTILSGGAGYTLNFWEAATGKLVRREDVSSSFSYRFALSPDGKEVATGNEKVVTLRDYATGKVVRSLKGLQRSALFLCFSPDGKLVVACERQTGAALIWDKRTGKLLARLLMGPVGQPLKQDAYVVAFSRDGKYPHHRAAGRDPYPAYVVAFSRDGKYLAVADLDIKIFEVGSWKHLVTLRGHSDHVYAIGFTPDNTKLVTGSGDGTSRVWDWAARKEVSRLTTDLAGEGAVTRDGKTVIGSNSEGRLMAWNLETGKRLYRTSPNTYSRGWTLSADESRVVSWSRSAIIVCDARTGKCLTPMPVPANPPQMMSFSPNGKFLAIAYLSHDFLEYRDIRLWGIRAGTDVRQPDMKERVPLAIRVNEGREVFSYGGDHEAGAEVWNITREKKAAELPQERPGYRAVFAKNGRVYAAGKELTAWDTGGNRIEWRTPIPYSLFDASLLLSADERILLGWRNGEAKSWNTITGKELSSFTLDESDRAVAISHDGKVFVTTAGPSTCLRNTRNGKAVHDFGKEYRAAAFSPDGRLLALSDGPGPIQLRDAKTMERLRSIEGHRDLVHLLLFSSDSRWLASVSADTTILVWDVRKITPKGK